MRSYAISFQLLDSKGVGMEPKKKNEKEKKKKCFTFEEELLGMDSRGTSWLEVVSSSDITGSLICF